MKKLYICAFSVMVVSWVGTLALLFILPAEIPLHLNPNAAGGVDRFGSKFECLVFPASVTVIGALFLLAARIQGKKGDAAAEKAYVLSSLPAMAIIFLFGLFCMLGGMGG